MARITFKDSPVTTVGSLPEVGSAAPAFTLCGVDLQDVSLDAFRGRTLVLNIVHSLDTRTCQASARRFNEEAGQRHQVVIANVSLDLPFAQKRFCAGEGLDHVLNLSAFRAPEFGRDYGVTYLDGPVRGLLSRAVVVIGPDGTVRYTEQVQESSAEPDYDALLSALD